MFWNRLVAVSVGLFGAVTIWASSGALSGDPAEWNSNEIYDILHRSPWSKNVKLSHSDKNLLSDNSGPSAPPSNATSTPRMGGGRRGMGASGYGGSGRSSGAPRTPESTSTTAQVMVQWQSALPVRMAKAKDDGEDPKTVLNQTSNDYLIGVVGLPFADFGLHPTSLDPNQEPDEQTRRLQQVLLSGASLIRAGHPPLSPTSVQLDQGRDGRILFHFPKTDPVTMKDKTVEFRLTAGGAKITARFALKEMELQGRLDL